MCIRDSDQVDTDEEDKDDRDQTADKKQEEELWKLRKSTALMHLHIKPKVWGLLKKRKKKENCCARNIASVRMNLRAQLDNVDVQQEDGTIINLGEKYGIKKRH